MRTAHLPFAYRLALLSARELHAACLYADGCSNQQVYRLLGTVSQTRQRVLEKLSLSKASQLREYRAELKARAGFIT